ncbi:SH3 domain-containing protein [Algihabitans albus]|uniref:SH3 domain-containing protein n=1 Tax=Algihabitans albus TaxID=2164067 RepID=UPI000E5D1A5E|nr:SH3 domain-containing protein [Algihabitans albus]
MWGIRGVSLAVLVAALCFVGPSAAQQTGSISVPAVEPAGSQRVGDSTGLPLPRFASVRASEAKMRIGPGLRYPAEWVYRLRNMPVEIIQEFDAWRKVRDWEGTEGWMHQSLLAGQRTVIVMADETLLLREPDEEAAGLARLQRGLVARLEACRQDWCAVSASGYRGWLPRTTVYGVFAGETFGG